MNKRIALALALLTAICVALLTLLAYRQSKEALHTSILRESATAISRTDLRIELALGTVKEDVRFLAGTPPIRGIQRARRAGGYDAETQSTYDMWAERFQQIMASLLRNKPDYWQARYLDERGQERVRVDSLDGTIKVAPKPALQNKAEHAYFTETMQLASGAIYISPLNLNREHDLVETPHRPTLRVATPIIDILGRRHGVVVINLHAASLLERVQGSIQALGGQAYLADQNGFFLTHPDPGKTFGFDVGFDYRLQHLHPRLAEKLRTMDKFVEHVADAELAGAEPHVHGFSKIAYDPNNPGNYWAVVFELPDSVAFASVATLRNNLLGFGLLIGTFGTLAGLLWARRFSRQAVDLAGTAEKITQGGADLRVDTATKSDEFLVLGRAFNRMLDSLASSERRFANIVNLAADAIISVGADQRIIVFNQGAERVFGYTAAEVVAQPLDMLLPAHFAEAHREHVRRFAGEPDTARDMNRRGEIRGRHRDGTEFPAEANISKVKENGNFQYTVFLRDISTRKQAEQALQQKDKLLTMVGAMAKVGGWEFDARTRKGTWTDEVARIHDMDPKDETGVEMGLSFFQGVSRKKLEAAVKDAIEHGTPYDLELEMLTAKGNRKWVRTIGQPVAEDGAIVKVWGSFQDITEHKRAEEEIHRLNADLERKVIERTAQLEATNKELEAFSYSVSHDLRAPLRAIDGFSQALLEDYADKLDAPGQAHLNRVRAATQRMGLLIDDMLTLSRVTRTEMRRETVNLSALAGDVLAELQRHEPERRVDWRVAPDLTVQGDPLLLRVALVNLLGNAWKFTGKTANATIEFGATRGTDGTPDYFVRDNGAGFDMTYANKLFSAFQRLHTAGEFPGTGIGLATAQRIIHRHGGRVWAEGAVGRGATFHFTV